MSKEGILVSPWVAQLTICFAPFAAVVSIICLSKTNLGVDGSIALKEYTSPYSRSNAMSEVEHDIYETVRSSFKHRGQPFSELAFPLTLTRAILAIITSLLAVYYYWTSTSATSINDITILSVLLWLHVVDVLRLTFTLQRKPSIHLAAHSLAISLAGSLSSYASPNIPLIVTASLAGHALLESCFPNYSTLGDSMPLKNSDMSSPLLPPINGALEDRPVPMGWNNTCLLSDALSAYTYPFVISQLKTLQGEDGHPDLPSEHSSAAALLDWRIKTPNFAHSLLIRIFYHFRRPFIIQQLMAWVDVFCLLVVPLFVQAILQFIVQRQSGSQVDLHYGLALVFGFFSVLLGHSFSATLAYNMGRRIGNRVRAVLLTEVFAKSLRLAGHRPVKDAEKSEKTENDCQMILSSDVMCITDQKELHLLWPVAPAMLVGTTILLYKIIGLAVIGSWVGIAILFPIKFWAMRQVFTNGLLQRNQADKRMALSKEILVNIRAIKFANLQSNFKCRLSEYREEEMRLFWRKRKYQILDFACLWSLPTFVTIATFVAHTYVLGHELDPVTAFTTLTALRQLTKPMDTLANLTNRTINSLVSLTRVETFLKQPETAKYDVLENEANGLEIKGAMLQWGQSGFRLQNIDIVFPKGQLTLVFGPVASGKSSLLNALLGEMPLLCGKILAPAPITISDTNATRIAYCSQTPFLLSETVQNNITFGSPFDPQRYDEVISACALLPDLSILPKGSQTEIGERGIILSGELSLLPSHAGQKARVALARAVYSSAEILLLDDVLSAVDYGTAQYLLRHVIKSPLVRARTVVLVSHYVSLVGPHAARLVEMRDGRISRICEASDLEWHQSSVTPVTESGLIVSLDPSGRKEESAACETKHHFVQAEIQNRGFSAPSLYKKWFAASGYISSFLCFGPLFGIAQSLTVGVNLLIRLWSSDSLHTDNFAYLLLFLSIAIAAICMEVVRLYIAMRLGRKAGEVFYTGLFDGIINASSRWHDTTPVGRILSRLSGDMFLIVDTVPFRFLSFGVNSWHTILLILAVAWSAPIFLALAVLSGGVIAISTFAYTKVSQELKRAESASRSPLASYIVEITTGLTSIRAYGVVDQVLQTASGLINDHLRPSLNMQAMLQAYAALQDCLGSFSTASVALFAVLSSSLSPALAGFALVCSTELSSKLYWTMMQIADLQISMTSVERVIDYLENSPQESEIGQQVPAAWPAVNGEIAVSKLCIRYAPHLPLVLRDLSFCIQGGEKIGVVGRTGAGKSSLSLAFFRFLESDSGSITIDGVDISSLNLSALRGRLNMIPQSLSTFNGSVRFNVDPAEEYDDAAVWSALRAVSLATNGERVGRVTSLDENVEENGRNYSTGEQQLIVIARSFVKLNRSNFVFLDEASASLDAETDKIIQQTIRREMKGATIICVAHRLQTVIDYDRIMVLDQGRLVEFDTPRKLLENPDGHFTALCKDSGSYEELLSLATETHSFSEAP